MESFFAPSVSPILTHVSAGGKDALDRWNGIVDEYYSSMAVDSERRSFHASLTRCEIDDLKLNWVRSPRSYIHRWLKSQPANGSGVVLLQLQVKGFGRQRQFGRETHIRPGEAAVCDPDSRYFLDFETWHEMAVLEIPLSRVVERRHDFDSQQWGGRPADARFSALLLSFLRPALEQAPEFLSDKDWCESVSRIALDLAISAIAGPAPRLASRPRIALRKSVIGYVESHLTDPSLRTSSIAEALGVSPRSVQSVFERMSITASGYILDRRLRLAAKELRGQRDLASITSIAFDCGFSDSAYFSRCFRRRFGMPPRDFAKK